MKPPSYTRLRPGATVRITSVESCPIGSVGTTADSFSQHPVPDVVGESPRRARSDLAGFYTQLAYGPLPAANRPTLDANYAVTQQDPPAGTTWQAVRADPFEVTPVFLTAQAR